MNSFKHFILSTEPISAKYQSGIVSIGYGTENGTRHYDYNNLYRGKFSLFQFTLDGEGIFQKANEPEIVLKRGEGFIVNSPSHTSYKLAQGKSWTFIYLLYRGDIAKYHTENIIKKFGHIIRLHPDSAPIALITNLFNDVVSNQVPDKFTLSSILYRFLMELYRELYGKTIDDKIHKAARMIEVHYANLALSLQLLAKDAASSPYHFLRKFKSVMGISPHQYLIKTRILKASELLISTNLSIKEISVKVGFKDPSYFCRVFKKAKKVTPEEYRYQKNVFY